MERPCNMGLGIVGMLRCLDFGSTTPFGGGFLLIEMDLKIETCMNEIKIDMVIRIYACFTGFQSFHSP